jgi:hypothetical protein
MYDSLYIDSAKQWHDYWIYHNRIAQWCKIIQITTTHPWSDNILQKLHTLYKVSHKPTTDHLVCYIKTQKFMNTFSPITEWTDEDGSAMPIIIQYGWCLEVCLPLCNVYMLQMAQLHKYSIFNALSWEEDFLFYMLFRFKETAWQFLHSL